MLKRFSFFNTAAPEWLLINKIHRPFLIGKEVQTVTVPGRRGTIPLARRSKEKEIKIDVTIMARHDVDLWQKAEWLAAWLDQPEEAPLTFNDEPDRYYMATYAGDGSTVEQFAAMGSGTITFLISDPYKYGLHVNRDLGSGATIKTIANQGTAPMQPLITARFTKASNFFGIVSPDGFVQLGQAAPVASTPVPPEERILTDNMNDLAPWTESGINLDYGQAGGKFYVEGGARFMVSDWGDSDTNKTAWHGAVLKRTLPAAVQDFRVMAEVELYTTKEKTGRVEIWLLDTTGAIQARMILWDRYTTAQLIGGTITTGNYNSNTPIITGEGRPNKGDWNNFKGRLVIRREGNEWRASISKINQYGREDPTTTLYAWKQASDYLKPISQIQIAIRKYGATPAPSATIREIYVDRINQVREEAGQVPSLFRAGDVLEIDNRTGNTWRNGEYFNKYLDPGSTFFSITPGTTELQAVAENPDGVTLNIDYDERYK